VEKSVEELVNEQLRHILHELSNLLTGILVTGGLLQLALKGDRRQRYAVELCEGSERGAMLVREARTLLASLGDRIPEHSQGAEAKLAEDSI
jgi:signal transduction histidine kinase